MSTFDHSILKNLSLSQSELAKALRTSRQAVNAGVRREETWIDPNKLLRLYDVFLVNRDRRSIIVEKILKEHYGTEVEKPTIDFISEEYWISHDRAVEVLNAIVENAPNGVFPKNITCKELGSALELLVERKCGENEPLMRIIEGWLGAKFRVQYKQELKKKIDTLLKDLS